MYTYWFPPRVTQRAAMKKPGCRISGFRSMQLSSLNARPSCSFQCFRPFSPVSLVSAISTIEFSSVFIR